MPYAMIPPGYSAVLLGEAADIEGLSAFTPLEEASAEGALILMRLDFTGPASSEALSELEQACLDSGVHLWPGYEHIVFADTTRPTVYLAWQKGLTWLPVMLGLLAVTALPPLLLAGIWLVLPDSLKSLISGLINMGMMVLVMWLVMSVIKPLMAAEKPEQIEERAE